MKKINYAGPWITEREVELVIDAVKNGFYKNYKLHAETLENNICEYLNIKYALATSSCTAALHLAVVSLGIKKGDEVITSDSSCVASAFPIKYVGATAVCVDVDPNTWCLSPQAIRKAITKNTKAVLVVHWNGHPADMDEIMSIANEYNLLVIEDSAPSLGAEYKDTKVGTIGDVGCFSFQGAKVAIGGQGGILVTNDENVYEKAKILAFFGRTDSRMQYWSDFLGYNYSMPNLPAALAIAQVERLQELIDKKREIFQWYESGLRDVKEIQLIREPPHTKSTYCYPPLLLKDTAQINRANLLSELRKKNIDCRNTQPRVCKMPMFEERFNNPISQLVEDKGIILSSAFNLQKDDIQFVCDQIKKIIKS